MNKIYFCSHVQAHPDHSANGGVHTWKEKNGYIYLPHIYSFALFISRLLCLFASDYGERAGWRVCVCVCEAQPIISSCYTVAGFRSPQQQSAIFGQTVFPAPLTALASFAVIHTDLSNQIGGKCVMGMSMKGQFKC